MSKGLELQEVRAGSMGGVEGADDIGPYAFHRVEGGGGIDGEQLHVIEYCTIGAKRIRSVLRPDVS